MTTPSIAVALTAFDHESVIPNADFVKRVKHNLDRGEGDRMLKRHQTISAALSNPSYLGARIIVAMNTLEKKTAVFEDPRNKDTPIIVPPGYFVDVSGACEPFVQHGGKFCDVNLIELVMNASVVGFKELVPTKPLHGTDVFFRTCSYDVINSPKNRIVANGVYAKTIRFWEWNPADIHPLTTNDLTVAFNLDPHRVMHVTFRGIGYVLHQNQYLTLDEQLLTLSIKDQMLIGEDDKLITVVYGLALPLQSQTEFDKSKVMYLSKNLPYPNTTYSPGSVFAFTTTREKALEENRRFAIAFNPTRAALCFDSNYGRFALDSGQLATIVGGKLKIVTAAFRDDCLTYSSDLQPVYLVPNLATIAIVEDPTPLLNIIGRCLLRSVYVVVDGLETAVVKMNSGAPTLTQLSLKLNDYLSTPTSALKMISELESSNPVFLLNKAGLTRITWSDDNGILASPVTPKDFPHLLSAVPHYLYGNVMDQIADILEQDDVPSMWILKYLAMWTELLGVPLALETRVMEGSLPSLNGKSHFDSILVKNVNDATLAPGPHSSPRQQTIVPSNPNHFFNQQWPTEPTMLLDDNFVFNTRWRG